MKESMRAEDAHAGPDLCFGPEIDTILIMKKWCCLQFVAGFFFRREKRLGMKKIEVSGIGRVW